VVLIFREKQTNKLQIDFKIYCFLSECIIVSIIEVRFSTPALSFRGLEFDNTLFLISALNGRESSHVDSSVLGFSTFFVVSLLKGTGVVVHDRHLKVIEL
jgi:hypothetical protein